MATVDKAFADKIIAGDGYYDNDDTDDLGDNPRCVKIVRYINAWGNEAYGLVMESDRDPARYDRHTEFVENPTVYWEYKA
jgi:hypothetical protein